MAKLDMECAFCEKPAVTMMSSTAVCREHKARAVDAFASQLLAAIMPTLEAWVKKVIEDSRNEGFPGLDGPMSDDSEER